jgi:hypothetical protein
VRLVNAVYGHRPWRGPPRLAYGKEPLTMEQAVRLIEGLQHQVTVLSFSLTAALLLLTAFVLLLVSILEQVRIAPV